MSDLLTRFEAYEGALPEEQKSAPLLDKFADYKKQTLAVSPQVETTSPSEESGVWSMFQDETNKPHADIFFEKLARWQEGEFIDPKEGGALIKQAKKTARIVATLPAIPLQFAHALLKDPRAAATGMNMMVGDALEHFALLVSSPFIPLTEEESDQLATYLANNPAGFAFTAALLSGISGLAKGPKAGVRVRANRSVKAPVRPAEAIKPEIRPEVPLEVVKPPIRQQLPNYLKPALDELPSRIVNETPILKVVKRGRDPFYDHPSKRLEVPLKKFAESELRNVEGNIVKLGALRTFQNEMIASWAWENLSPKEYNAWRKSVGRPESFDVRGASGMLAHVDTFAESTISWMEGRPWGKSDKFFKDLFEKEVPVEVTERVVPGIRGGVKVALEQRIEKPIEALPAESLADIQKVNRMTEDAINTLEAQRLKSGEPLEIVTDRIETLGLQIGAKARAYRQEYNKILNKYEGAKDQSGLSKELEVLNKRMSGDLSQIRQMLGAKPRVTKLEELDAMLGKEVIELEATVKATKPTIWTGRKRDLQRIHTKQRGISTKDPNFRELKKRTANKESLKDFTQEEMAKFELELDRMLAEKAVKLVEPRDVTPKLPTRDVKGRFKKVEEIIREPGEDLINKAPSETLISSEKITDASVPSGMFDPEVARGPLGKLKIIPDFIKQTRNRVRTEPGQAILARVRKGDELLHRRVGTMIEKFNKIGLKTVRKRGWGVRLGQALQKEGGAGAYRELFDEMYLDAASQGVKVANYTKEYFPRMIKRDIAEILQSDVAFLERKALKESADIWPLLKEAIQKKHIRPETITALDKLVNSGQATTYVDAIAKLKNFSHNEMFSPFGNLELTRKLELPLDFYDMDAAKVIPQYIYGWAKRLAEVEQFGAKSEIYHDLRQKVDAISPSERHIVDQVVASWTRSINRDPRYTMPKKWKKFVDTFVQFEVTTKIGLGLATIPNITQSLISTIPLFGVYRTSRGFYRSLLRGQTRNLTKSSGALLDISARQWSGYETTGLMGKVADRVLSVAFTPVNKMNAMISAATVEFALPGYYKLANMAPKGKFGKARVAHAKRVLEFLDVNPRKPLTENVTLEAMYRAATDLQLMRNILRDPLSAHNPRLKAAWLFKRFGLKQAQLIKDTVLSEVKHGNVMPLLRLAVGGYLGGEFVLWARNLIKSTVSGKEYYSEDKEGWERAATIYSTIGAFGVVTDLIDSGIFGDYPLAETLEFTLFPVQVQTLGKIADTVVRFLNEASGDYGLIGATTRLRGTAPRLLGPLGTQLTKRIQTDTQRNLRLKHERTLVRVKILDLFLDEKTDQAIRVWTAWNKHNLRNIAFGQYDEFGQFLGRLNNIGTLLEEREMQKAKKRARP